MLNGCVKRNMAARVSSSPVGQETWVWPTRGGLMARPGRASTSTRVSSGEFDGAPLELTVLGYRLFEDLEALAPRCPHEFRAVEGRDQLECRR